MKRLAAILGVALVVVAGGAKPGSFETLVLTEGRAVPFVLHVEIDGRPFEAVWSDAVHAIFADADVDGNGSLDAKESERVLSALRIRQLGWGYLWAVPEAADWKELDRSPRDGKVTLEELADYYSRHLANASQAGVGETPPAAALTDALTARLNANRDGRISEAEWKIAEAALRPLDRDDDELIRPNELVARTLYPGSAGGVLFVSNASARGAPRLAGLPLVHLPADPTESVVVPAKVGTVSADTDRNGRLDSAEVAAIRKSSRAASATVRLGTRKPDQPEVTGQFAELKGVRPIVYAVPSTLIDDFASARKTALERFAAADANGDGALDAPEIQVAGHAPLRDHFAFADRNRDARLAKSEWEAYLDLRSTLVKSLATVTVLDHGRGLFEVLDADSDGALSTRELRTSWDRLKALGYIEMGELDLMKLPRSIRFVASRGRPQSLVRTPSRDGPDWFRAMDRNRDGDVSRREFLGGEAAFDKIDADRDGLISANEAEPKKAR